MTPANGYDTSVPSIHPSAFCLLPPNTFRRYPNGPARNPTSVQRGSVQFLSIYPGDPSTPGYPAYENATRTARTSVPDIPSLPISWTNAEVLLREIGMFGGAGQNRTVRLVNHGMFSNR